MGMEEEEHRLEPTPEESGPVAWDGDGNVFGRFAATLREAFSPLKKAGSFATDPALGRAVAFAIVTFVPLAFLQGIVPFTRTLQFGPMFAVGPLEGGPSITAELDIAIAGGISLLVMSALLVALLASFESLVGAFGSDVEGAKASPRRSALRCVLYRAWLLPVMGQAGLAAEGELWHPGLLVDVLLWGLPESMGSAGAILLFVASVGVTVWFFLSLRHAAKASAGVGALTSIVVTVVPLTLMSVIHSLMLSLLSGWLPTPPG